MLLNLNVDAKKLIEWFDEFSLALITTSDYINQTTNSFDDYLQMYEQSWTDLIENNDNLMKYDDRTLYSTWNLSLKQIVAQDSQAAKIFKMMKYLENANLWYELFRKDVKFVSNWFCNITKSKARFNKAMMILHNYSLIETMSSHYNFHACVHDWILKYLIDKFDVALFDLAMHCITQNVARNFMFEYWLINDRLYHHVLRIKRCYQKKLVDWNVMNADDMYNINYLKNMTSLLKEAKKMYVRALKKYEKTWSAKHTSTLNTINNLNHFYVDQNKMIETKKMYVRALKDFKKIYDVDYSWVLLVAFNLSLLTNARN